MVLVIGLGELQTAFMLLCCSERLHNGCGITLVSTLLSVLITWVSLLFTLLIGFNHIGISGNHTSFTLVSILSTQVDCQGDCARGLPFTSTESQSNRETD